MHLDPFQREALTHTYWHRLVSTDQLRRMSARPQHVRNVQQLLAQLRRAGLLDKLRRQRRPHLWYTTREGAALVESAGLVAARAYRVNPDTAMLLHEHASDVVETGLAFMAWARRDGHDCSPLSWTPEVAHHYNPRESVISDAVLHYTAEEGGQRFQRAFMIELDRATMPVARLAQKLLGYVRYHDYAPGPPHGDGRVAWQQRYPRFPRVLVVLTGAPEHVLDRRLADLRGHAEALNGLALARDRVAIYGTTLERLRHHGPAGDIAIPVLAESATPLSLIGPTRVRAA